MLASVLVSILFAAGGHARPRATHAARAATNELPVKSGIVSFGDSYGAGLGTGTTSGDSCRVGSNNYAELVWRYMDKPDIKLQKLVCTGDTTKELSAKIDKWQNPKDYDMATLSVGGNDLGFSDIVDACFLRIVLGTPTKGYDEDCDNAKKKANALLADSSSDGIKAKLTSSYKKILTKSGRDVSHGAENIRKKNKNQADRVGFPHLRHGLRRILQRRHRDLQRLDVFLLEPQLPARPQGRQRLSGQGAACRDELDAQQVQRCHQGCH